VTGGALLLAAGTIGIITAAAGANDQKPAKENGANAAPATKTTPKALVFRNQPSWNRTPDFEDVLANERLNFEVKSSSEIAATDLAPYGFVIIPGSQGRDYYEDYVLNAARFDRYVRSGGTLVLELNGAEGRNITLPAGVTMAKHGALDNLILVADHPVLAQFSGKQIHANFASHGYLEGVPAGALVLVTEMVEEKAALDRPTFIEYSHGKGRVLAACQCFHDRDKSGRGVLMPSLVSYAAEKEWYKPTKQARP
jgi:hypothetical protein